MSVATIESALRRQAARARESARILATASGAARNEALRLMADRLLEGAGGILGANQEDMAAARERGVSPALLDRLLLTRERLEEMAEGLRTVARLADPLGRGESWTLANGLRIERRRVPLGVVGVIYEARPNVTADIAGLCLKAGCAVLLRGGSEAFRSNQAITAALQAGAAAAGLPAASVQLVEAGDRESARLMMHMVGAIDVLIPRGGAGLIRTVVQEARVPVIETGEGVCHTYVHSDADLEKACRIVINAKTQRPSVCNAMETLLVHRDIAPRFLPRVARELQGRGVELRGCERTVRLVPEAKPATEEDWGTEYLDLILAVRVVDDLEEAIEHITRYGTKHSEAIVTESLGAASRFVEAVDAAAVYVNASTRFTDGGQFGFGAEVGISTQKLHARGPMGLEALTTTKYVVTGDGHVRE